MKIIILAGGGGTRLYPLSTPEKPKQFLPLAEGKPLLINTIERFLSVCRIQDIVIVTGERYRELTQNTLSQYGCEKVNIVYEPCARNTAPAIMLAVKYCIEKLNCGKDEILFAAPSDHVIKPLDKYLETVKFAAESAKNGGIVTLGIAPTSPDTGFGYIKAEKSGGRIKKALAFKEKPDRETAQKYLESGDYYWNAGMFCFSACAFGSELKKNAAGLYNYYVKPYNEIVAAFGEVEKISIDYAIAERSDNISVVPCNFDWSDIGSWDAYYDYCDKDKDGNVIIGNVKAVDCTDSLILSNGCKIGVSGQCDAIIIVSGNNTVVLSRGRSQSVRELN